MVRLAQAISRLAVRTAKVPVVRRLRSALQKRIETGVDPCMESQSLKWVRASLGDNRHERQVRTTAQRLFDLVGADLHLGPADNRLLRLAAVLHDIGRADSEKRHPQVGAKMILAAEIAFTAADRRALAYLTRYHRSGPPKKDTILRRGDPAARLKRILSVLEVADVLDSRHLGRPAVKLRYDGTSLTIDCGVDSAVDTAKRIYSRRKKYAPLEKYLKRPVKVRVSLVAR